MEKAELIEILAKSQENILNCVDSKLQDLKRSISEEQEDCVRFVVKRKKEKEDQSISWKEGKKLLAERQKLIKLADRSECGWATVSAYLADDLADTPDDERRISKAEKSAKKAWDARKEKSRSKSTGFKSNYFAPSNDYLHLRSSTDSSF